MSSPHSAKLPAIITATRERVERQPVVRGALALLLALVGLFIVDALLFRSGLYPQFLDPDSAAGQFELTLRREQQAQRRYGDNLVACLGDSRLGLAPREAARVAPQTGYLLRLAGVAGSDPRTWYYMLRDLDPTRRRYRAIVFAVNDYDDEDGKYDPADDIRPLHYVIDRLRLGDVPDFYRLFLPGPMQREAFRGSLLKGFVYQADLQAFLANPLKRIRYVSLCNRGWPQWTWDYQESARNMVGLRIDWTAWKPTFSPDADQFQRESVRDFLMYPPAPQTGRFAALRRNWFARIFDLYRDSPTKIIFVRLARGPIPRPDNLVHKLSGSIREFARRPNVLLVPEHAFDSLEHPEFFKDAMHLNREGVARFSEMLSREVGALLGPRGAQEEGR
jgi:hypothetical protein